MLGEKIGSLKATCTNKPLPAEGSLPSFETTAEGDGTLAGVEVQTMATYWAKMRTDGSLIGECPNQGLLMAADGVATFRATGVGKFTDTGGSSFRGAVYFQTSASSLSDLNGKCFVYHWEVDAEGAARWDIWHWE